MKIFHWFFLVLQGTGASCETKNLLLGNCNDDKAILYVSITIN